MSVYIIRAGGNDGPVKIGRSNVSVNTRLNNMQTASADRLILLRQMPGNHTVEAWLHKKFKANHIRGEWFEFHSDMLVVEVPVALLEADEVGSPKSKQKDQIEVAAFDYHIQRGFSELAIPNHIVAHQALLLRAFQNGSIFMSLAGDALARLNSVRAGGDAGAAGKAEEQYRNICELAELWDEEVRRLDAEMDPALDRLVPRPLVSDEVSEAAEEAVNAATHRSAAG